MRDLCRFTRILGAITEHLGQQTWPAGHEIHLESHSQRNARGFPDAKLLNCPGLYPGSFGSAHHVHYLQRH